MKNTAFETKSCYSRIIRPRRPNLIIKSYLIQIDVFNWFRRRIFHELNYGIRYVWNVRLMCELVKQEKWKNEMAYCVYETNFNPKFHEMLIFTRCLYLDYVFCSAFIFSNCWQIAVQWITYPIPSYLDWTTHISQLSLKLASVSRFKTGSLDGHEKFTAFDDIFVSPFWFVNFRR